MSFLARMQYGNYGPQSGFGIKGFAMDKGERVLASALFGYIKGHYHEQATIMGYGADLWAGAALTLASAYLQTGSGGRSGLARHLERVGDAGLMSYFNSLGVAYGAEKAGRVVAVLQPGAKAPPLAGFPQSILGAIPPATGGAFLTADEIAAYTGSR